MSYQPTPEQVDEANKATAEFQTAMIALGAQTFAGAVGLYADVPAIPQASNATATAKWLTAAVAFVMLKHGKARDLAMAYYRYERALLTGRTIQLPGDDHTPSTHTTLPELKRELDQQLHPDVVYPPLPDEPDAVQIPVDDVPGLSAALDEMDKQTEEQTKANLQVLGPQNQDYNVRKSKATDTAESDKARQDAHQKAGNRQAAAAARNAMNGARGSLYQATDRDKSALGWVRISKTGTPCGFCAMLISRGFVYRSAASAGEFDLYHDNCHCTAIPVFTQKQYDTGEIFALNRNYQKLWPIVTKGYGGKAALSRWRRFIRQEAKSQKTQVAAA